MKKSNPTLDAAVMDLIGRKPQLSFIEMSCDCHPNCVSLMWDSSKDNEKIRSKAKQEHQNMVHVEQHKNVQQREVYTFSPSRNIADCDVAISEFTKKHQGSSVSVTITDSEATIDVCANGKQYRNTVNLDDSTSWTEYVCEGMIFVCKNN